MPNADLSSRELELVAQDRCACGCGRSIPPAPSWGSRSVFYHSPACKQKAYRARKKAGRVIPADVRRQEIARQDAAEALALADQYDGQARYWKAQAAEARAKAARILLAAGLESLEPPKPPKPPKPERPKLYPGDDEGQTYIPGTEPERRLIHA